MKLQTMLLPTGEFALIISEAPADTFDYYEALLDFREQCGAVAGLVVPHPVEVVDALVDGDAVGTHSQIYIPRATTPEGQAYELTFQLDKRPGDDNLFDMLVNGKDFSPAGLVTNGTGPESADVVEKDHRRRQEEAVDKARALLERTRFQKGDIVKINGSSWMDGGENIGRQGRVVDPDQPRKYYQAHTVEVRVDGDGVRLYRPEDLELIRPAGDPEPSTEVVDLQSLKIH